MVEPPDARGDPPVPGPASNVWVALSILACLVVGVVAFFLGFAWVQGPCVAWETTHDEALDDGWFERSSECGDTRLTTNSRLQAHAFLLTATLAFLAASALAIAGVLRGRLRWFWSGIVLLFVVCVPRGYAFIFFDEASPFVARDSIVATISMPFHFGVVCLPPLFLAARQAGLGSPAHRASRRAMKAIAVLLVLADAFVLWLWIFATEGGADPGEAPLGMWLLLLTPPAVAIAAFGRRPRPDPAAA